MTYISPPHQDWLNRGSPDSGLARPLAQLRDVLRGAGFTVYDMPDFSHLNAVPPEDHTQFSQTGWPNTSPKWWRHAIDIMPRKTASDPTGVKGLQAIGQQIVADRNAGRITWVKYINWPASGSLDSAVQDRWEPSHERRSSSDTGHIHLSSTTGVETLDAPYNPLAALAGAIGGYVTTPVTDLRVKLIFEMWSPSKDEWVKAGGKPEVYDLLAQDGSGTNELGNFLREMDGKLNELLSVIKALQAGQAGTSSGGPVAVSGGTVSLTLSGSGSLTVAPTSAPAGGAS